MTVCGTVCWYVWEMDVSVHERQGISVLLWERRDGQRCFGMLQDMKHQRPTCWCVGGWNLWYPTTPMYLKPWTSQNSLAHPNLSWDVPRHDGKDKCTSIVCEGGGISQVGICWEFLDMTDQLGCSRMYFDIPGHPESGQQGNLMCRTYSTDRRVERKVLSSPERLCPPFKLWAIVTCTHLAALGPVWNFNTAVSPPIQSVYWTATTIRWRR